MANVTVCTWNIGDNGSKSDLGNLMDRAAIIGLQEAADRDPFYEYARDHGWKTLDGNGEDGKHSTPTFYDPDRLTFKKELVRKLSDSQKVNPGAGPEQVKTKWAIGGQFHVPGASGAFRFWTCHLVASSSSGERHALAHDQIVVLSKLFPDADGPCVIGGDFNTKWNDELVDPLKSKGWKSCHAYGSGPYDTHGDWTPDHVWHRNAKISGCSTVKNGSDHNALLVTFTV